MKSYGVSRSTAASPERLWQLWSDPNNWSRWNSGIRAAQVEALPLKDGTKGRMTTQHGSEHEVTFHDVVAGRGFSMSMSGPPMTTFTFSCEIAPGDGSPTKIAQSVAIRGPLGFLFGAMMGAQMAQHFVPLLDDLAKAAEAT